MHFDALLDFLLGEIALCGSQGKSTVLSSHFRVIGPFLRLAFLHVYISLLFSFRTNARRDYLTSSLFVI